MLRSDSLSVVACVVVAGATLFGPCSADGAQDCVANIEAFRAADGQARLLAALEECRTGRLSLNDDEFRRLMVIVDDPARPTEVRSGVLGLVSCLSSSEQSLQIAERMSVWNSVLSDPKWVAGGEHGRAVPELALVGVGLYASERDVFASGAVRSSGYLQVVVDALAGESPAVPPGRLMDMETIFLLLPLSPEERSQLATKALTRPAVPTDVRPTLAEVLNEQSLKDVREYLKGRLTSDDGVPLVAAATLAHRGDIATLPVLQEARKGISGVDSKSLYLQRMLDKYIWMIEVQQHPGSIPELFRGELNAEQTGLEWKRQWLLSRAVAIGVDRPALRSALLEYAHAALERAKVQRGSEAHLSNLKTQLADLKGQAIDLGVLMNTDLPEVPRKDNPNRRVIQGRTNCHQAE